jgi:uncharacterized protein YegL
MADDEMQTYNIPNTPFQYSGVVPESLTDSEYTLACFVTDTSGSVGSYVNDLEKALDISLESCKKSPRAGNIRARTLTFNDKVSELHGYSELTKIEPYAGKLSCSGCTALYDAVYNAIGATVDYAKKLQDLYYSVNAVIYIITDGMDNRSTYRPEDIKKLISDVVKKEQLGFLTTLLIGINEDTDTKRYLDDFKNGAELTKYISIGDASSSKLAHLGGFISKSLSSSSQSLANGTAPDPNTLSF